MFIITILSLYKIFCKLSRLIQDISLGANVSAAEWMWMTCQAQQDFSQFGARSWRQMLHKII